jgi:hypothetical protein
MHVNQLSKLNNKQKLFLWLYLPYDIDETGKTLDTMIDLGKKYGVSDNVLFRKVIEHLNIKNYSKDQILETLYKYKFLSINDLNNLNHFEKVTDTINEICDIGVNELDMQTISKLIELTDSHNHQETCSHSGYPTLDEQYGRPHMGWCKCYHANCFNMFNNADQLREHLKKLTNYKYGFHMYHEQIVSSKQLTPEKILSQKITRCPSLVCDKSNHDFTPDELCEHFMLLGIYPFWKHGMKIKYKNILHDVFEKLYINDECIICLGENAKPSILFQPCNHCCMCANCYQKINKCPICRKDVTSVLPI